MDGQREERWRRHGHEERRASLVTTKIKKWAIAETVAAS